MIHALMINGDFHGPIRIIGCPRVGIPSMVDFILTENCLITEKRVMRNQAMFRHLLEKLRTAIAIILFKNPNTS
jgi:hypothetical protein